MALTDDEHAELLELRRRAADRTRPPDPPAILTEFRYGPPEDGPIDPPSVRSSDQRTLWRLCGILPTSHDEDANMPPPEDD